MISTPLSSLQRMMDAAVAGIAVTGAVLAALLLLLWTRGRKREVGIFLALGKGKGEILLQFFAENLLLALPAGAAALGLAALLGERAGDILAAANGVEGLDVAVRFQDAAAVYGLGALLLALAVLLAAATALGSALWSPGSPRFWTSLGLSAALTVLAAALWRGMRE